MPPAGGVIRSLLFTPLPELTPPGFAESQLEGLRSLPSFCGRLRLILALKALEPLAEGPPAAAVEALSLAAEILAALGAFAARNPQVSLAALRSAAALTLIDLRLRQPVTPLDEAELVRCPQVVLLEAAAMVPLRRARSAGKTARVRYCAARMILELWELADKSVGGRWRRDPGAGHRFR